MRELIPGVSDVQLRGTARGGQPLWVSAFLVDGERETLVDTGWRETADELVAALDDAGARPERVFLTHDGRDHYGGLDRVMERFEPELVAPGAEAGLLDAIDHEPDRLVDDGDRVGGMEAVVLPGHTPAPASLYLPGQRALIAGDVLDGSDRRGLPPGFLLPPPVRYNEDHEAAEENVSRLLEYDLDSVLVFHGSHVIGGAGERLDRLVRTADRFQEPAGVVESGGADG